MRVLAVRDDGAQLIGDDDLSCALLRSEDSSAVMPVASATARGYWEDPHGFFGDEAIPEETEAKIRAASAEFDKNAPA